MVSENINLGVDDEGFVNGKNSTLITIHAFKKINDGLRPKWVNDIPLEYLNDGQRFGRDVLKKIAVPPQTLNSELIYLRDGWLSSVYDFGHPVRQLRYYNGRGKCRRVESFIPSSDYSSFVIRREDWFPKSTWRVTGEVEASKAATNRVFQILRKQ